MKNFFSKIYCSWPYELAFSAKLSTTTFFHGKIGYLTYFRGKKVNSTCIQAKKKSFLTQILTGKKLVGLRKPCYPPNYNVSRRYEGKIPRLFPSIPGFWCRYRFFMEAHFSYWRDSGVSLKGRTLPSPYATTFDLSLVSSIAALTNSQKVLSN